MACSLEALDARVGHFEQLTERLLERLESLAVRLDSQFAQRLEAVEREVDRKVSAEQCRELVAEALSPLDAWIEDLAQLACRRPRLAASPPAERPAPEPTPERRLSPTAGAASREEAPRSPPRPASSQRDTDEDNGGGQRSNAPISIVVEFSQDVGPRAGSNNEVTLEVRGFDRISYLKQKALEQLEVWGRFCRIGQLAEDDQSSDDEAEDAAASALPPLSACHLYTAEEARDGRRRLLSEHDSVAESDLQHGMRLLLVPETAASAQPAAQPPQAAPSAPAAPAQPPVAAAPAPARPERLAEEQAAASQGSGQSSPISLVVAHHDGEVTVEARTSDSVQFVKCRAHAQLSVWYRFCGVSDKPTADLPPLEECHLWTTGSDGAAAALLQERCHLEDCSLELGQRLLLRAEG